MSKPCGPKKRRCPMYKKIPDTLWEPIAPLCGKDPSEGLGANPTDRGRSGTKLHLLVDEQGMPLSFVVQGTNVHDSRLVGATHQASLLPCPDEHPHLCLDRGYDYPRAHEEVACLGYEAHIKQRGIQEEAVQIEGANGIPPVVGS